MKVVKKNVYYCDHCKKKGLSATHIRSHEMHCTNNPNRHCKLCGTTSIADLIQQFRARFTLTKHVVVKSLDIDFTEDYREYDVNWVDKPVTLDEIREAVGNCPNCIFAILRQVGFNRHYFDLEKFDYLGELKAELEERNNNHSETYYY